MNFPYERRDQLLGALISSFGSYSKRFVKGTATYFDWPKDNGIHLFVRASTSPSCGHFAAIDRECAAPGHFQSFQ